MQVFISWSGAQSKHVAIALRTWLPAVLDLRITPFVSSEDIDKGDRGLTKIAVQLQESSYGIVVLTPSNQNSPWVNFEAGALGKALEESRVAPLLVGLTDVDVKGPIKQFQNAEASDSEAVLDLVRSINKCLDDPLSEPTLIVLFEKLWPELESKIAQAPKDESAELSKPRDEGDVINEVLTTVRSLKRDIAKMQRSVMPSPRGSFSNLSRDVSQLIGDTLDLDSLSAIHSEDGLVMYLPENAGKLESDTLSKLQALAQHYERSVKVIRPDGSSVTYDEMGIESRTLRSQTDSGPDAE